MQLSSAIAPPRRGRVTIWNDSHDERSLTYGFVEGLIAAMLIVSRMFIQAGAPAAAFFIALTLAYCWMRPAQFQNAVGRSWPAWIYPLLALASISWAVLPVATGRASVQMCVTALAGLMLAHSRRPVAVVIGLACAFVGYTLVSLVVGKTEPVGMHEIALVGIGGGAKNFFAEAATTGVLLMVALAALSLQHRRALLALALLPLALACAYTVLKANSAGASVSAAIAVAFLLLLLAIRPFAPQTKLLVLGCVAIAALAGLLLKDVILDQLLTTFHKDPGLTGRGYLWWKADEFMAARPWLGVGYYGFWQPQNPDAQGLWRYFKIMDEGTGFSFHNAWIQTRIDTGYVGLAALIVSWLVCGAGLLRRIVNEQSVPVAFWASYFMCEMAKTGVEPIRPSTLLVPTIMLFGALGTGTASYPAGGGPRPERQWRRRYSRSANAEPVPLR